jgi:biotin carboxyl carrier protein
MKHFFTIEGERQRAWLVHRDGGHALIAERDVPVRIERGDGAAARLYVGDTLFDILLATSGDVAFVHIDGHELEIRFEAAVAVFEHEAEAHGDAVARAPMPGLVLSIQVEPGQAVTAGDVLVIIESMKLETSIKAPRAGIVESVHVAAGQTFDRDAPLVSLAAEE